MYVKTVAARIVRLTEKRAALLAGGINGATHAAKLATDLAYIDGKIDALEGVIEDATGETATAELIARLAA